MGETEVRMALGARKCPPANLSMEMEPHIVNKWGTVYASTMGDYERLAHQAWVAELVRQVRDGEEWKKHWLPFRCSHFYRFAFGKRNQKSLLREAFLWQTTVDIDDGTAEEQQTAIERALQLNADAGSEWHDKVLQIERSARGKVHIDVRMPVGMTIQETQLALIHALGVNVEPDSSCFSPERMIFITGIAEELYRSEQWYSLLGADECQMRYEKLQERKLEPWTVQKELKIENGKMKIKKPTENTAQPNVQCSMLNVQLRRCLYIFDKCMSEVGLKPENLIVEGARHNSLKSILSVGATQLLTKEELMAVLQVRMAEHWQDDNIVQLVEDFYRNYTDTSQKMTIFQRKVLADSLRLIENSELKIENEENVQCSMLNAQSSGVDSTNAYLNASYPPTLPAALPPFMEVLLSRLPDEYKPAVAMASFTALGCHPEGLWWNYIDDRRHEPAFMHVVVAPQSVGKSCVNKPLEVLMEDVRMADEVNRKREQEWKQARSSRSANKEKPKRPEGLRIQMIPPDTTCAAFAQRLDDVNGKFLFTNMDELDLLNNLNAGSKGKQATQIIRLAFDQGYYGQERVGVDSVTANSQVRWNWNAGCTVAKAQRFFRGSGSDGTLSRISFSTIIEDATGRMPMFKPYDDSYAEALHPYIEHLNEATGMVVCEEADQLAWRLNEENQQIASTSMDEVFKILCRRANVIAHQRAMMLWITHGKEWSAEIEQFVTWSLKYDLWCKMHFFGQMMETELRNESVNPRKGPRNFLSTLDRDTFDIGYLQQKMREKGMATSVSDMVSQWKHRKLIAVDENGRITRLTPGLTVDS